jgi:hypothetical protein
MVKPQQVGGGRFPAILGSRFGLSLGIFALSLFVYTMTLAPGTVFGDPSEYQFIPAIWGIAHPPGYAVYTLFAGIWQRVIVVGSVAYRTNLLAAAMGAWTASRVALIAYEVLSRLSKPTIRSGWIAMLSALSGLAVGLAPDVWQHSIHANAHIMSAAITTTQVWALVRWWAGGQDAGQNAGRVAWLYLLAFLVGIGVAHHPITVWGIPAYLVFIIMSQPRIVLAWRTILLGIVCVGVGLLPWLYFPLRSPTAPFGPTDMATWEGFLRHATAQGLRVNLFHFGPADQPDRLLVFTGLLRLQFGWLLLVVALIGLVRLLVAAPRLGVLWLGYVGGHLAFTLNSVQDVMAYLLHPFVAVGLPLAVGLLLVLELRVRAMARRSIRSWVALVALAAVIVGRGVWHFPRISLRAWREADEFVAALELAYKGQGEGATLVSDWEHLTPYFYHTYVEGLALDPMDLAYVYVTGATPWAESVFGSLAAGPTYLSTYRREVRELGFRLRPALAGKLWQVLEPPAMSDVAPSHRIERWLGDGQLEVIGVDLTQTVAQPGEVIPITLYARVATTQTDILIPVARLGQVEQRWTTDSRRLTPAWFPKEVIAEQYHVHIPFDMAPGDRTLWLSYQNASRSGELLAFDDGADAVRIGEIRVVQPSRRTAVGHLPPGVLTNIGNEVALTAVRARAGLAIRQGLWNRPLAVSPGGVLHLQLRWHVLARPSASYTVFVHLMDEAGNLLYGHDYTPLGGAFPSYLWFPKWLPGQRVIDPYRLVLPEALPAGDYWLEVGMYEMGTIRRIAQLDHDGTMTGDRLILGPITVHP